MRRFPNAILTSLSHPTTTTTALLRPLSTKPTTTANDEWNDAWESAWLPDDLSGQNRAPWESDVNFCLPHTPPTAAAAATDVDAETKAFVEDMTDNWEQRRKSPKTQQRQEKEEKLKEMEKSSLYSLESMKRDYRVQKQRIHAGLWVKEIEKQEEDKLGDGFGGGDGIESLLDSCSEYDFLPLSLLFLSHLYLGCVSAILLVGLQTNRVDREQLVAPLGLVRLVIKSSRFRLVY